MENKNDSKQKEYIITYRSQEHFEVLGWVFAYNMEDAVQEAKIKLADEIKKYNVKNAEIAEWKDGREILL